jgi:hypothetical protein
LKEETKQHEHSGQTTTSQIKTMIGQLNKVLTLLAFLAHFCISIVSAGEAEFMQLQEKVEQTVLEFRDVVEDAYLNRCETSNIDACYRSNFHGCLSSFPEASCPEANDFTFEACGGGPDCSSLFDFSTSSVRYPPSTILNGDLDLDLVESTCFSQNLDNYFISNREEDEQYWAGWGVENPCMHFSAATGMYRIYPARPDDRCFEYDPRIRPFYVAASSGPKNVLLLLDTSGSMDGLRMSYMKEAAERVVDSLAIGDRVAIIPFSTRAEKVEIGSQPLVKASAEVKEQLKGIIRNLQAVGSTNFYDAFNRAFSIMDEAIPRELIVNCNTALLFLTDGKMTEPSEMSEPEVLEYVQSGLERLQTSIGHPVRLFTYSISENNQVHYFPKELACGGATPGVWSKIFNAQDIVSSLSSYYQLFA